MIYLDNSATTYPKPECVYQALDFANRNYAFNAGRGSYKESTDTSLMIEECRKKLSNLVGLKSDSVVFTSSATEALNLIINGVEFQKGDCVYITPFEHNSIVRPLFNLKDSIGIEICVLPFDKITWEPLFDKIDDMFSYKKPVAIFCSQVSNVTGLEINYLKLFERAKAYGALTILDSAQSFGVKNPNLINADFCVFAGHKSLYASFGVAGFIINSKYKLNVIKSGGNGSESLNHYMPNEGYARYESGSQNSVAIYGLLKSIEWLSKQDVESVERTLSNKLISELKNMDNIELYLPSSEKSLGIVSFNVKGYSSDDVASILYNEYGIMIRSGYHCSPFVHEFINSIEYKGTVRVSFGAFNTENDINVLIEALKTL